MNGWDNGGTRRTRQLGEVVEMMLQPGQMPTRPRYLHKRHHQTGPESPAGGQCVIFTSRRPSGSFQACSACR